MRVLIAGAGEVGFRVGRDLVFRGHEVTLIDSNSTNPTETSDNSTASQSDTNNPSTDPANGTEESDTSAKTLDETNGPKKSTYGSQQQQTSNGFSNTDGSTKTGQENTEANTARVQREKLIMKNKSSNQAKTNKHINLNLRDDEFV